MRKIFGFIFAAAAVFQLGLTSTASAQSVAEILVDQWKVDSMNEVGKGHSYATCRAMPTNVSYSPALRACRGKAAITVRGRLKSFFSVQLRKANGSDRLNPNCGDADCSPYKVQRYITNSTSRTGCFGAAGKASVMRVVNYTTIKRHSRDSSPLSYCIADPKVAIN